MREVWHEGKRVVSIVEITSRTKVSRAGGGKAKLFQRIPTHSNTQFALEKGAKK